MNSLILTLHLISGLTIQVNDQWEVRRIQEYVNMDHSYKFMKVSNMKINMHCVEYIEENLIPCVPSPEEKK